jgi:hypothetical protein
MKAKLLILAFLVIAAASCTKTKVDNVTNTVTDTINRTVIDTVLQMPTSSIIAKNIEVDSLPNFSIASAVEFGSEFYASDSGVISKLGCLCVTKDSIYTVSLWDFDSHALVASASITCTDSLHFIYANITPVNISANKHYIISYNTKGLPFYLAELKGDPTLAFPFSNGSITFVNSYFAISPTAMFPNNNENDYLTPADFVFQVK